jgi:hypothetical protein
MSIVDLRTKNVAMKEHVDLPSKHFFYRPKLREKHDSTTKHRFRANVPVWIQTNPTQPCAHD